MTFDLAALLSRRVRFSTLALLTLSVLYIALSIAGFFQWIQPSLDGRTDQHIAADSTLYMYFADSIREGRNDPIVLAAMATFPNTLWAPVLMGIALKDPLAFVFANYVMFCLAIMLLRKSFSVSTSLLVALLLLNPTTTISLLSLNKEIFDLFGISLFLYARTARLKTVLVIALLIALVSRYEVSAIMLLYLFVTSRWNPWRSQRGRTILMIVLAINILLPLFGSDALSVRFEEAEGGGVVTLLDSLEMHYLYILAVIPKILENLFAELLNFSKWATYGADDLANSYIVGFNNLANAIVVVLLWKKRRLTIQNDLIYLAAISATLMAISLVIQPRYFYIVYVLLCLRAAERGENEMHSRQLTLANPESIPA